jgi:hypothetical protein
MGWSTQNSTFSSIGLLSLLLIYFLIVCFHIQEEDGDHEQRLLPNYVEDSVSNRINSFEVKEEISVDEDGIRLHSVDTVV